MVKLGILGCGNIGRFVMESLSTRDDFKEFSLEVIADLPAVEGDLKALAEKYGCAYTTDPMTFIGRGLEVVMESAHPAAVKRYAPALLRSGINMLTMSVGAYADPEVFAEAKRAAEEGNCKLLLPTGGIAAIDYLKAARLSGMQEATLTMVKEPKALAGAPYFQEHPMDLFAIKEPTVVFEGTAAEAIKGFPQNTNVAVALSLATLGPEKTRIKVVCDPNATRIAVEIYGRAASGEIKLEVVNLPSPSNPKTSYQTCVSALMTLRRFVDHVQMGT